MDYAPLVVTDNTDSIAQSSAEIDRKVSKLSHLDDFQYVHCCGLPHRSVHIEIVNSEGMFFVWERKDGRMEIPGGHVDWLTDENRPETYEEAARRETVEELKLDKMMSGMKDALKKLKGYLVPVGKFINQIPGAHVNNNEWVTVYRLHWFKDLKDPCEHLKELAEQEKDQEFEGIALSARWMSLQEIKEKSLANPMGINAALRLFLRREGILVPVNLNEYFKKYKKYCKKICKKKDDFVLKKKPGATAP